jgi:hypothetical protein
MITMDDDRIVSDSTSHYAMLATEFWWVLSWLPGRVVTENQALTGILIAEELNAAPAPDDLSSLQGWIDTWASGLGLSGIAATAAVRNCAARPETSVQHAY